MKTFVLSVAVLAVAAGSAQAQVLKYAGFEASEGYVLGDLFGQMAGPTPATLPM